MKKTTEETKSAPRKLTREELETGVLAAGCCTQGCCVVVNPGVPVINPNPVIPIIRPIGG